MLTQIEQQHIIARAYKQASDDEQQGMNPVLKALLAAAGIGASAAILHHTGLASKGIDAVKGVFGHGAPVAEVAAAPASFMDKMKGYAGDIYGTGRQYAGQAADAFSGLSTGKKVGLGAGALGALGLAGLGISGLAHHGVIGKGEFRYGATPRFDGVVRPEWAKTVSKPYSKISEALGELGNYFKKAPHVTV